MNRPRYDNTGSSAIATKAELLQRLRNRPKPQVHARLTPSGPELSESYKTLQRENEHRIALLRTSLLNAHEVVEVQHSFSRLFGYAKSHFKRER